MAREMTYLHSFICLFVTPPFNKIKFSEPIHVVLTKQKFVVVFYMQDFFS